MNATRVYTASQNGMLSRADVFKLPEAAIVRIRVPRIKEAKTTSHETFELSHLAYVSPP